MHSNDALFVDDTYLEIKNTPELHRVLFDLPKTAKPALNDIYRLSLDKDRVQKSIEEARKKKGEWSKFQMLYDLHPVMKYLMTKLEASVDKDVALVAKIPKLPKNTAWYVIHGQVANNIGQSVISDFFVVPLNIEGGLLKKPMKLKDFIVEFEVNRELATQNIPEDTLTRLESLLPDVIDFASEMHMHQLQQVQQMEMEKHIAIYRENLKHWTKSAKEQMQADFEEKGETNYWKGKLKEREREIDTIISETSQFYRDLTSLNQNPYLKVISVFYN
jgi:hypothetical protein